MPDGRRRLLILTAGVGAGHDGAAAAWAERLAGAGYEVEIRDLLTVLRRRRRPGLSWLYEVVLHRAPWIYELLFRAGTRPTGVLLARGLMGAVLDRVEHLIAEVDHDTTAYAPDRVPLTAGGRGSRRPVPGWFGRRRAAPGSLDGVLCTYPLAGHLIGELRRQGRLRMPAVSFLTDFSVHRLCVAPGVDAHFALHPVSAEQAAACGATPVVVSGPVVGGDFVVSDGPDPAGRLPASARRAARARFGLPADGRLALLVAGSWGIGDVASTAEDIARTGVAIPVVVCGRNDRLRQLLTERGIGVALGWVADMPLLMRAVDVLVENAGGLTSLEAMVSGLPVASYRPIAGHGRTNAEALDRAGVSCYVRSREQLGQTLLELMDGPRGQRQRRNAELLFRSDPVAALETVLTTAASLPTTADRSARRPAGVSATAVRVGGWARHVAAVALLLVLATVGSTAGTDFAVAHGVRSVRPAKPSSASYLVVRPGPRTEFPETAVDLLRRTGSSVAVDRSFAEHRPGTVRALAAAGVPIINAAADPPDRSWLLGEPGAIRGGMATITDLTGVRPTLYLASGRIDAVGLGVVSSLHERVVRPGALLDDDEPITVQPAQVVLIDCSRDPDCDLTATLDAVRRQADRHRVRLAPITVLAR